MAYALAITVGIALAYVVRRLTPSSDYPQRLPLTVIAAVGALSGAMLFEMPADWWGLTATIAGEPIHAHGLGGRTVLGGILGGWLAVEAAKPALGIRGSTGAGFAAPLAVALAGGRVGCALTGCCAGRIARPGDWWSSIAVLGPDGARRFPAQLAEVLFHAAAAVLLVALARRRIGEGRRLAAYVAIYCVVRVLIELVRDNPVTVGGVTYYQWLAAPLFLLAGGTWLVRHVRGTGAPARAAA